MGSVADSVVANIRTIIDEYRLFSKGNDTKVDFFDIFVFDNVKSGLKIIHYQPNKMGFKVKVLPTLLSTFAFLQRCFITISCHCVILFHNLFFNPAVIVLHEVDALNRCYQSPAIYSITSVLLNFGLCYYVTNISGIELYDIFKYTPHEYLYTSYVPLGT